MHVSFIVELEINHRIYMVEVSPNGENVIPL